MSPCNLVLVLGILKTTQPVNTNNASGGGKKSQQPITMDLGAMIDALEVSDTLCKGTTILPSVYKGAYPW